MEAAKRCGWLWEFNSPTQMHLESADPLKSLYTGTLWHKTLDSLAQKEQINSWGNHPFKADIPVTLDAFNSPSELDKPKCAHVYPDGRVCAMSIYGHMKDPFEVHATASLLAIKQHYIKVAQREPLQEELEPTRKIINLVRCMLQNYLEFYHGRLIPEDFVYIQTEQQFFKILPNTEHCTCYYNAKCSCGFLKNGVRKSCRHVNGIYTQCKCVHTECPCRKSHVLEGKLDGLILHVPTNNIYILENKTFSVHTAVSELKRISQFMGYTWIGLDFDTTGVLYNGAWTRDHIPSGKVLSDLFARYVLAWAKEEITEWQNQASRTALYTLDPRYIPTRTVHPVGGCNGVNQCGYKKLCDARFKTANYNIILNTEYRKKDDVDETTMFSV